MAQTLQKMLKSLKIRKTKKLFQIAGDERDIKTDINEQY